MIIAIDYDGTLADTNAEKARWIKGRLGLDVAPWRCNRTDCVPVIGEAAYKEMSACVYEREATLRARPVPGAIEALRRLAAAARLFVLSARPPRQLAIAGQWLGEQGAMECVQGLLSSQGGSKAAICADIGADVLVDDDIRHLRNAAADRLRRVLLRAGAPDEAGGATGDAGLIVCTGWSDILAQLRVEAGG